MAKYYSTLPARDSCGCALLREGCCASLKVGGEPPAASRSLDRRFEQQFHQARRMHRLPLRAVRDLVAAARAVGDDDRVGLRRAPPAAGSLGHLHRARRRASPRSRSCRPCRSTSSRSVAAARPGSASARRGSERTAPNAFWWQWPCTRIGAVGGAAAPARSGRPSLRVRRTPRTAAPAARPSRPSSPRPHHQRLVAQRQQARRLEADDRRCRPRRTAAARRSAPRPCALASSTMPVARIRAAAAVVRRRPWRACARA